MTRTATPPGKPSFNKGARRRVIPSMDLTRLTGSISSPAVFLFLLSLFFAGCKKTEQVPHETPTLIYEHPVTMDIPVTGSWVGHLDGVDNASIVPQITGYLQTQNYANGAIVKKGEVLFRIDDSTFRDQVSKAKATLAQAQAQLQQLNYDAEIYRPLAAENAISKQKYEDTRLSALAAEAQVQQAAAALALAEKNLSYTVLYEPASPGQTSATWSARKAARLPSSPPSIPSASISPSPSRNGFSRRGKTGMKASRRAASWTLR